MRIRTAVINGLRALPAELAIRRRNPHRPLPDRDRGDASAGGARSLGAGAERTEAGQHLPRHRNVLRGRDAGKRARHRAARRPDRAGRPGRREPDRRGAAARDAERRRAEPAGKARSRRRDVPDRRTERPGCRASSSDRPDNGPRQPGQGRYRRCCATTWPSCCTRCAKAAKPETIGPETANPGPRTRTRNSRTGPRTGEAGARDRRGRRASAADPQRRPQPDPPALPPGGTMGGPAAGRRMEGPDDHARGRRTARPGEHRPARTAVPCAAPHGERRQHGGEEQPKLVARRPGHGQTVTAGRSRARARRDSLPRGGRPLRRRRGASAADRVQLRRNRKRGNAGRHHPDRQLAGRKRGGAPDRYETVERTASAGGHVPVHGAHYVRTMHRKTQRGNRQRGAAPPPAHPHGERHAAAPLPRKNHERAGLPPVAPDRTADPARTRSGTSRTWTRGWARSGPPTPSGSRAQSRTCGATTRSRKPTWWQPNG